MATGCPMNTIVVGPSFTGREEEIYEAVKMFLTEDQAGVSRPFLCLVDSEFSFFSLSLFVPLIVFQLIYF